VLVVFGKFEHITPEFYVTRGLFAHEMKPPKVVDVTWLAWFAVRSQQSPSPIARSFVAKCTPSTQQVLEVVVGKGRSGQMMRKFHPNQLL
jgi:hypothetical protein